MEKFTIKLYTDKGVVDFGTMSSKSKEKIMTPDDDGFCRYSCNGEHYCFTANDVEIQEVKVKLLIKTTEYCEEGACASSYSTAILGAILDNNDIEQIIKNDVDEHHYIKNCDGNWWNGLSFGWEIYTYQIKEVPIL